MSKIYVILLALFSFIFLFPQLSYGAEYKIVIRVVSGDTIIVDGGEAVRLIGTVAPQDKESNDKAKEFLEKLLLAEEVDLVNDNVNNAIAHKDQFGRRLAYVYRTSDNLFLNREVIRRGLCFYSSMRLQKESTSFLLEQQNARKTKLGIWESVSSSPLEEAETLKQSYKEPTFKLKSTDKAPDIRVEIIWVKKANIKKPITRSGDEANLLTKIFSSLDPNSDKVSLNLQVRKIFAEVVTKYYQDQNVKLIVETEGDTAETLKFIAEGMDQKDADSFCAIPLNRELFASLEFKQVVFTDGGAFSYTHKVEE